MRDLNRIKPIIDTVTQVWNKHPDLRLGQMLENLTGYDEDLYYVEDDELLKRLNNLKGE